MRVGATFNPPAINGKPSKDRPQRRGDAKRLVGQAVTALLGGTFRSEIRINTSGIRYPYGAYRGGAPELNMSDITRRWRPLPWHIGLLVIVAAVIYVGMQMFAGPSPAPAFLELGFVIVIPAVYLVLMYLTLTSQA